ncbi:uncharacterized protein DFL_002903 [Arthrobotrys flagrans]|uniref:Uncharacterized protein n=1 Tax=Arthrobotrys flagrans TaxID=97331 RepID=A0A437ACB5_ARTFL|nr:hypothetical protein DFL_002903 [Arthrobotrys flagrans]
MEMDKITYSSCNDRDDEKKVPSHNVNAEAKLDGFVVPSIKLSASKSDEGALGSLNPENLQDSSVILSPKKGVQMLKYRVRNHNEKEGENKENENGGAADNTWNANQDDTELEDSRFEFGFEKKFETVEIEDHGYELIKSEDDETIKAEETDGASDADSFQRAASITSSCVDPLENAEILTAKEVTIIPHTVKDVSLEERTLIRPHDDDMTAPLLPKIKVFETTVHGKIEAQRLFRSLGCVLPREDKENVPKNINAAVVEPGSSEFDVPKALNSQPRGRGRPRPPPPGVVRLDYDTLTVLASIPDVKKEDLDSSSLLEVAEDIKVPMLPLPQEAIKEPVPVLPLPSEVTKEVAPTIEPEISTYNKTKAIILPSATFYPPSPTRAAPPAPPKDAKSTLGTPCDHTGRQTPVPRSETPIKRPIPSPTPSKKYKELNLRPPIPITPLQHSMHLYGSTAALPLPKENNNNTTTTTTTGPEGKNKNDGGGGLGLSNFSRRRTLFGNYLTVPSANDNHLRRASYNPPSTHSVRLPLPNTPGMQLPRRPGTACGIDRPDSSASARSSKRERIKNFFKKF